MTLTNNRHIGLANEKKAQDFLQKQGFMLIDSNVFTRYGEIDLIVTRNGLLLFVEVKSRTRKSTTHLQAPEQNMSRKKLLHFFRAAESLVPRYQCTDWWCAVVLIEPDTIQWFELRADTL